MLSFIRKILLITSFIVLTGCGGGGGDSTSGGGSDLNLAGTWRVVPVINIPGFQARAFTVNLAHDGNTITGAIVSVDPLSPGFVSCGNDAPTTLTGVIAGNTVSGEVRSPISVVSYSVSGTSTSLSGTFNITFTSGICAGSWGGTVTLTKI